MRSQSFKTFQFIAHLISAPVAQTHTYTPQQQHHPAFSERYRYIYLCFVCLLYISLCLLFFFGFTWRVAFAGAMDFLAKLNPIARCDCNLWMAYSLSVDFHLFPFPSLSTHTRLFVCRFLLCDVRFSILGIVCGQFTFLLHQVQDQFQLQSDHFIGRSIII